MSNRVGQSGKADHLGQYAPRSAQPAPHVTAQVTAGQSGAGFLGAHAPGQHRPGDGRA
ncbi:hypothetical protein [Streptomyces sp. KMM 9044]|uniref:hypothetical protein n=1 Tax=Streptomyces sp. KMM 9044 TaxID=2744474 RepID=UPI0021518B90|nr:hypothetical protein [Streptomyces sp. KMM 9044]WAX81056.1 hypothetical protein HUV60_028755 [Streptomyces sp. KMM 9044]